MVVAFAMVVVEWSIRWVPIVKRSEVEVVRSKNMGREVTKGCYGLAHEVET